MTRYAIWKDKKVIGYIKLLEEQAETLNSVKGIDVYFGFDGTIKPEQYNK